MSSRISASIRPAVLPASYQRVAHRFTFGLSEAQAKQMRDTGNLSKWVERQMAWRKMSDARATQVIRWYPRLTDTPTVAWSRVVKDERSAWDYGFDFDCYSTARKIVARRQIHEVMSDFWSNLLYIPSGEDRSFPWRYSYDNAVRANALGSFRGLLRATIVHPAMSGWLNNSSNTKNGPNENLGRELLELFTVGRPAGYDENDVKNSARILTGYKVKVFEGYAASYSPEDHYVGPISVLGFRHRNSSPDGRAAVNAYLDYLARHPATAQRIAHRLCVRFVSDTPSKSLLSAVARSFRASDTDIRATLRTLMKHPEFTRSRRTKVRTPVEDVVNSARVLGMRPTGSKRGSSFAQQVIWMSSNMGQMPFKWPRPDGFPEASATWTSPARVLRSWNMHYNLAGNWWRSTEVFVPSRPSQLPSRWPRTLGQIVDHQSRMLLGRPAPPALRKAVAVALDMPERQVLKNAAAVSEWRWTVIRGAVLNMPEGMLR